MVSTTSLRTFLLLCQVDGENRFAIVTNDMGSPLNDSTEKGIGPATRPAGYARHISLALGIRHRRATLNGPGCPRGRLLRRTVPLPRLVTEHRFEVTPVEPCAYNDIPSVC